MAHQSLTLGSLALGSTTNSYASGNYGTLNYVLGASGIEPIDLGPAGSSTGVVTLNSGGGYVEVTGVPISGTYTLMNFASQTGSGSFSLNPTTAAVTSLRVGVDTYTLADNATSLTLTIVGTPVPAVAYWKGGTRAPRGMMFRPPRPPIGRRTWPAAPMPETSRQRSPT